MSELVFDPDWVEGVRRRYERLPSYQRPVIYSIAVDEKREELRSQIETWVGQLPLATREKLLPRLRSPKNIQQTYNELVIGHALRQLGFEPEYERTIGGYTPDWFVGAKGRTSSFVVEAFTSNPPEGRVAGLRRLDYFLGRLQEIPVNVTLKVRADGARKIPDQHGSRKIKKAVEQWLVSSSPVIGAHLRSGGFAFQVIGESSRVQHVLCIGPANLPDNTFWVNSKPLTEGIESKVKKYKFLGKKGMPLAIGVVPDFYSGLGYDDLENVLFGEEAIEITYEIATGNEIGHQTVRRDNGLLKRIDPALSAVLWFSTEVGDWETKAIHNPNASNPLPPLILD